MTTFQTPIDENPDFAVLRFHAGPPYEVGFVFSLFLMNGLEPVCEKTKKLGSDQVRHKLGCTVAEDGYRLESLDSESRGIVLSV